MKKPFLLIFGLLILQMNFSCKSEYSTTELKNNFSTEQINDLKKITHFFKSQICENPKSNFEECFKALLPEISEEGYQPISDHIDFEKQLKLYESISKSTFDEIWSFCKATYPDTGLEFKSLCPVLNGKYLKYLDDLGKNNIGILEHANQINASGDFRIFLIENWEVFSGYFDLNDPNIQLILAIHYLSQNDQQYRNEKWETE